MITMNPEKPLSPKDAAALERMGSDRVMEDLRNKYKQPQTQAEPEFSPAMKDARSAGVEFNVLDDLRSKYQQPQVQAEPAFQGTDQGAILKGMGNVWKVDTQRRREEQERLSVGSTIVHETYSVQELAQIAQVRERLDMMIARFDVQVAGLDKKSPEYIKKAKLEVAKMVAYLDGLPLWKFKFSTEIGAGVVGPLVEDESDSLYYMTASGISMRLRRASLEEGHGLNRVAQPFMEKMRFRAPQINHFDGIPTLGSTVEDYATREFSERLRNPGEKSDFVSPLAVWVKDGKPVAVGGSDDAYIHNGDRVNRIFE